MTLTSFRCLRWPNWQHSQYLSQMAFSATMIRVSLLFIRHNSTSADEKVAVVTVFDAAGLIVIFAELTRSKILFSKTATETLFPTV